MLSKGIWNIIEAWFGFTISVENYEKELQESHAVISARMAEEFLSQYELSKELINLLLKE